MHMKPSVTALIIAKNEEKMIANCLATLQWCDHVIVLDAGSDDRTPDLAKQAGAQVVHFQSTSFARKREKIASMAKTEWVFYIDADERVTPQLAQEIQVHIETTDQNALAMNRQNIMFGQAFLHGGWSPEWVTRVFRTEQLKGWEGDIHESPIFEGSAVQLHTSLIHLTHRQTTDGLQKTISWTPIEAKLLAESGVAAVTFWTILRKGLMEFWRRGIWRQAWKDGQAGSIEALIQAINRMLVYIQVWEHQQHPSLPERYDAIEKEVAQQWARAATATPPSHSSTP